MQLCADWGMNAFAYLLKHCICNNWINIISSLASCTWETYVIVAHWETKLNSSWILNWSRTRSVSYASSPKTVERSAAWLRKKTLLKPHTKPEKNVFVSFICLIFLLLWLLFLFFRKVSVKVSCPVQFTLLVQTAAAAPKTPKMFVNASRDKIRKGFFLWFSDYLFITFPIGCAARVAVSYWMPIRICLVLRPIWIEFCIIYATVAKKFELMWFGFCFCFFFLLYF